MDKNLPVSRVFSDRLPSGSNTSFYTIVQAIKYFDQKLYQENTFRVDKFCHTACCRKCRKSSLIQTFYVFFFQGVEGDWICLQFRRSVLKKRFGIVVKDEEAMPVGSQDVSQDWKEKKWVCPHVYGGIPLQCVEKTYPMKRDGPKYVGIEGLTN